METSKEKIDRYLSGRMSKTEKASFEGEMEQNEELAAEIVRLQPAYEATRMFGRLELKEKLKEIEAEIPAGSVRTIWLTPFFRMAAAIALLGVSVGILWWISDRTGQHPEQLFTAYYQPYRAPVNIRSETDSTQRTWQEASLAYEAGDYQTSARLFANLKGTSETPYLSQFYQALSLLGQPTPDPNQALSLHGQSEPDLDRAITLLTSVLDSDNDYHEPARWYLALAHIRLNNLPEARKWLESLSSYKKKEAEELLGRID